MLFALAKVDFEDVRLEFPRGLDKFKTAEIAPEDYTVMRSVFEDAQRRWGQCTVDAFASPATALLPLAPELPWLPPRPDQVVPRAIHIQAHARVAGIRSASFRGSVVVPLI